MKGEGNNMKMIDNFQKEQGWSLVIVEVEVVGRSDGHVAPWW